MFLHAVDTANRGYRIIMLRTVDTDVLVLAVPSAVLLENTELWVTFGTGKLLSCIPAHDIATALGDGKARSLPMLQAFTGWEGKRLHLTSGNPSMKSLQYS